MAKHIVLFLGMIAAGWIASANAQDGCARLASLRLPNTTITKAQTIPEGDFQAPPPAPGIVVPIVRLPAHCRVAGSIRPTADSDIRFEVWLPVAGWDHRYQQVGNSGLAGSIVYISMIEPLLRGSATAATDDGHQNQRAFDATWATGHPQKLIDYGYRAVHLTALAGEAIVRAYYGQAALHTYFTGCSDGGRESLMEAQRYPQDFEGYLVGAPGIDIENGAVQHLNVWQALHSLGPEGQLTPAQLRALSAKALERCDALDGLKDGQVRDPRECAFKAVEAECGSGSTDGSCLSAAQAAAVQRIYDGVRNGGDEQLAPGNFATVGTEAVTWPGIFLDSPNGPSLSSFVSAGPIGALLYDNPKLDLVTVNLEQAVSDAKRKIGPIINPESSDLRGAQRLGRKILHYHGWADPNIAPEYSLEYFQAVQRFLQADTQRFYRLFMVPGMAHCSGGVGPTAFGGFSFEPLPRDSPHNWVSALERWVEDGVAPEEMIGTEFKSTAARRLDTEEPPVRRTRPVCSYPRVAVYQGRGSTDDAANFRCGVAASPR